MRIIDATCPLVAKVHLQCRRYAAEGCEVIIVGHQGLEEVEGTVGSFDGRAHVVATVAEVQALELARPDSVAYVTQTTLGMDDTLEVIAAVKDKYPAVQGPGIDDICYATRNRQSAVRELAGMVDVLLVDELLVDELPVIGATNKSKFNRLREIAGLCSVPSCLIRDHTEIHDQGLMGASSVGLTAGASAPDSLVQQVITGLQRSGPLTVRVMDGITETTVFRLPRQLLEVAQALHIRQD